MSNEQLSQDEINALINNQLNKKKGIDDYLSSIEQDALGEIGNITFGTASTTLSSLLNQKVDITTPTVHLIQTKDLQNEFPEPLVAVHVEYTKGFQGVNLLVIQENDAKIIANLMMGGDGTDLDEELSEFHLSAVQEAMNQMMGSAATSMHTIFNKVVDISPPGINILDIANGENDGLLSKEDVLIKVSFRIKIGELIDSNLMQLLPVEFAKDLVNQLINPDETEEVEEVKPEVKAVPVHQEEELYHTPQPSNFGGNMENSNNQPKHANVQPVQFSSFDTSYPMGELESRNLDMLLDIPLQVTVELGRTKRSIQEILTLSQGSIIELDKLAGEPVDILVNNKPIAKGEVVVIDENFGVRVTDILSPVDRLRKLK